MASPDITLGPGDTAPVTRLQLRQPNKADGSLGDPLPLHGATAFLRFQIRDRTLPWEDRTAAVVDADLGIVEVDWLATGGPVVPPDASRRDYDARVHITLASGHQLSYPNGRLTPSISPDGFLWMHVSKDFTEVAP